MSNYTYLDGEGKAKVIFDPVSKLPDGSTKAKNERGYKLIPDSNKRTPENGRKKPTYKDIGKGGKI